MSMRSVSVALYSSGLAIGTRRYHTLLRRRSFDVLRIRERLPRVLARAVEAIHRLAHRVVAILEVARRCRVQALDELVGVVDAHPERRELVVEIEAVDDRER